MRECWKSSGLTVSCCEFKAVTRRRSARWWLLSQLRHHEGRVHANATFVPASVCDKDNAGWQRDLSISLAGVGNALRQLGQTDTAMKYYQNAVAIAKKLADADRHNVQARSDLDWVTKRISHCTDAMVAMAGLDAIDKADARRRPWLHYVRAAEVAR